MPEVPRPSSPIGGPQEEHAKLIAAADAYIADKTAAKLRTLNTQIKTCWSILLLLKESEKMHAQAHIVDFDHELMRVKDDHVGRSRLTVVDHYHKLAVIALDKGLEAAEEHHRSSAFRG